MGDIILRLVPLPTTVNGLTVQDEEGKYNIYLNSKHTHEAHIETLKHEMQHINSNDFTSDLYIKKIEG